MQINPGQQISRQERSPHYTRSERLVPRREDEEQLGALEVGRLGDVAVLDHDYFSVPAEQSQEDPSALTVVGGEVVHDTGDVR